MIRGTVEECAPWSGCAFSTFTGMVGLKPYQTMLSPVLPTPVASREQCPISNYFTGVLHGIVRGVS